MCRSCGQGVNEVLDRLATEAREDRNQICEKEQKPGARRIGRRTAPELGSPPAPGSRYRLVFYRMNQTAASFVTDSRSDPISEPSFTVRIFARSWLFGYVGHAQLDPEHGCVPKDPQEWKLADLQFRGGWPSFREVHWEPVVRSPPQLSLSPRDLCSPLVRSSKPLCR